MEIPKVMRDVLMKSAEGSNDQLIQMAKNPVIRNIVTREMEKQILTWLEDSRFDPEKIPGIEEDRSDMALAIMGSINRAMAGKLLSDQYIRAILQLLVKGLFIENGDQITARQFAGQYGEYPPSFLLLSPGKACNLRCTGCYADADVRTKALDWSIVDRLVSEAKSLWGVRLFVISGGEPFAYRSEGKGIIDLIEKHNDCFFMAYTNSTLIDEEIAGRLAKTGNMILCISVEGWRNRTDERRGEGVFDKVVDKMGLLRSHGVPFGISLTGTRFNAEEILSDEFIDFFMKQGALFAWLFQYMPIGRAYTLDLMVSPQQRLWMWRRSWEIMRGRRFFIADFWNHGTCVDGCLSAGGHGKGGYFYIDWNGAVSPCVFMPYSPVNIKDVYAGGGNLNDIWQEPFFRSLRNWQVDFAAKRRNMLAPCPNRDHHDELEEMIRKYEPDPIDQNAAETLTDPAYTSGLVEYNEAFEILSGGIWQEKYLREAGKSGTSSALQNKVPNGNETEMAGAREEAILQAASHHQA